MIKRDFYDPSLVYFHGRVTALIQFHVTGLENISLAVPRIVLKKKSGSPSTVKNLNSVWVIRLKYNFDG